MGDPGNGEESHPTAKNFLISPTRKIPLNKFTSAIKNVVPSPSNINFHLIIYPIQASFVAVAIADVSFLYQLQALCAHMLC